MPRVLSPPHLQSWSVFPKRIEIKKQGQNSLVSCFQNIMIQTGWADTLTDWFFTHVFIRNPGTKTFATIISSPLYTLVYLPETYYRALFYSWKSKKKLVSQLEQARVSPPSSRFLFLKQRAVGRKQNIEWKEEQKGTKRKTNSQGLLSGQTNKLTFLQVLLHIAFTFIGLSPCSITKVLTGADYYNKSCGPRGGVTQRTGMQKGLPEVQQGPGPEPCPEDG